jgi:hypothetical protein
VFIPEDAVWSTLVLMVTPVGFPAVAAPMVRPVSVTVTAVLAGMMELDGAIVIMMTV